MTRLPPRPREKRKKLPMLHVVLLTKVNQELRFLLVKKTYTIAFKDLMKRPRLFSEHHKFGEHSIMYVLSLCSTKELEELAKLNCGDELATMARKFEQSLDKKKSLRGDPNRCASRTVDKDWDSVVSVLPEYIENSLSHRRRVEPKLYFSFVRGFTEQTESPHSSAKAFKVIERFIVPEKAHLVTFLESKSAEVQVTCNVGGLYPEEVNTSVFHFAYVPFDALVLESPDDLTILKTFSVDECIASEEVNPDVRRVVAEFVDKDFVNEVLDVEMTNLLGKMTISTTATPTTPTTTPTTPTTPTTTNNTNSNATTAATKVSPTKSIGLNIV